MTIKFPRFERREIEIRESYIDENGNFRERSKKLSVPTGKILSFDEIDESEIKIDIEED